MGKSTTNSCFKLITCGNHESVDSDHLLHAPEVKDSSDRRKWSFRKKSAKDRVLENYVVSDTSSGNKASPDTATVSFQTQSDPPTSQKPSEILSTEDKTLVLKPETNLSETVDATDHNSTINLNESAVIIIQAAIRGFLAENMLLKKKKIIKLQAAVRGHIVRRHAIGSLRCIQAIVKMQALVRGRRARILLEEPITDVYKGKLDQSATSQARVEYTSLNKLLKNSFARQLLESKQSTETMNFKCDPLKSDSAWRWMERWMSASSIASNDSLKFESSIERKSDGCVERPEYQSDDASSPRENSQLIDNKLSPQESGASSEGDENVITYEVCSHESDALGPSLSSLSGHISKPCFLSSGTDTSFDKAINPLDQMTESNSVSETKPDSIKSPSEIDVSHPEEPETTENKLLLGSGKADIPSSTTAQLDFEELCLATGSGNSVSLPNQDARPIFSCDTVPLPSNLRPMEISPVEHFLTPALGIEVGGSECGTELSISSTLDSPDRLEAGLSHNKKEATALEARDEHKKNHMNRIVDDHSVISIAGKDSSFSHSVLQERPDNSLLTDSEQKIGSSKDLISSLADQIPEAKETDVKVHVETDVSHQVSMRSPEASPRSRMTLPDSQDTPSSHASVKPKKISSRKSGDNHKYSSKNSGKKNVSDPHHDSGVKNSSEQFSKNHKTGKRRDSVGSARSDNDDHEPRDSSSSNSLPSYMQATESARAKAAANSSPRSSPDVMGKDFYIKKRHSLPSSNTKQGSPCVQQPVSQSPQNTNSTHSPQERKWKR